MPDLHRRLIAALAGLSAALSIGVSAAFAFCGETAVRLVGADPDARDAICARVERAVDQLASCHLAPTHEISIRLVRSLPESCLGLYDCAARRIELLAPDAFAAARLDIGPFAEIDVGDHFDSVIVHELTHAAYDDQGCPSGSCVVTAEYLAYAMQVHALPDVARQSFEAGSLVEPDEARAFLTETMLMMSPERFSMAAWALFSSQPDPCGHVRDILDGRTSLETVRR